MNVEQGDAADRLWPPLIARALGMKKHYQPMCTRVEGTERYDAPELRSLASDGHDLTVVVEDKQGLALTLTFRNTIGFRVLDESDLLEYWNQYSSPNGWLWLVQSGGWLGLEQSRAMFDSQEWYGDALEYFIVGNRCVNVITRQPPELTADES